MCSVQYILGGNMLVISKKIYSTLRNDKIASFIDKWLDFRSTIRSKAMKNKLIGFDFKIIRKPIFQKTLNLLNLFQPHFDNRIYIFQFSLKRSSLPYVCTSTYSTCTVLWNDEIMPNVLLLALIVPNSSVCSVSRAL